MNISGRSGFRRLDLTVGNDSWFSGSVYRIDNNVQFALELGDAHKCSRLLDAAIKKHPGEGAVPIDEWTQEA